MATGLKRFLTDIGLRQSSVVYLEQGLEEAGLSNIDRARMGPRELEQLRDIAANTLLEETVADCEAVVGTNLNPKERKAHRDIWLPVIKRSPLLAQIVSDMLTEGDRKREAAQTALVAQVGGLQQQIEQAQQLLLALANAQTSRMQNATTPVSPAAPDAPKLRKRSDGLHEDDHGTVYGVMNGVLTKVDIEPEFATAPVSTAPAGI